MKKETIGITGGIGAGKSIVSRILRCNGMPVIDCDFLAKKLMVEDSELKKKLTKRISPEIYSPQGELLRKKLASIIFSDSSKRLIVNELVHGAVRDFILKKRKDTSGRLFIESAILATGKIDHICDKIWVIEAPVYLRFSRVSQRDSASRSEIEKRMVAQENEMSNLDKSKLVFIDNDDSSCVLPTVLKLIDNFKLQNRYSILC